MKRSVVVGFWRIGVDVQWRNGWSVAATFEGEFSEVTRSYGGKGLLRYLW